MNQCCSNPLDLGCKASCGSITTNIIAQAGETYFILYSFLGTLISRTLIVSSNGYLTIPANYFPEQGNYTFEIFSEDGASIQCFKVRMLPGDTSIEIGPQPIMIPVNTAIEFEVSGCSGDTFRGIMRIITSQMAMIVDQVVINFHHIIENNGQPVLHSIVPLSQGFTLMGDDIMVTDGSLIGQFIELAVLVDNKNCNKHFSIDAHVDHIENLPAPYLNDVNTPMDQFIYP